MTPASSTMGDPVEKRPGLLLLSLLGIAHTSLLGALSSLVKFCPRHPCVSRGTAAAVATGTARNTTLQGAPAFLDFSVSSRGKDSKGLRRAFGVVD